MVQLKVRIAIAEKIKRDISIPYGSIKSDFRKNIRWQIDDFNSLWFN